MQGKIRTAVIAAAAENVRRDALYALSCANIELLGFVRSGDEVLPMLEKLRPDLLAVDAELPAMDGRTLAGRILNSFCLPVRPAVALMRFQEFMLPGETAASAVLLDKPLQPDSFIRAEEALIASRSIFSPAQQKRADLLLDALGVPDHIGRDCLKLAALLCAADEGKLHCLGRKVYPVLGEMHSITAAQAERAIRRVIERAWQSDKFENQYRIFADTVDAARGQPTASEMISRLADILRLEG